MYFNSERKEMILTKKNFFAHRGHFIHTPLFWENVLRGVEGNKVSYKVLWHLPSPKNYMIEWISSSFLKKKKWFYLTEPKSFIFFFSLLLDWHDLRENTHLWVQNADMSTFLPTLHASFIIYLTIKLPSLEFFLPTANSFLHRSVN